MNRAISLLFILMPFMLLACKNSALEMFKNGMVDESLAEMEKYTEHHPDDPEGYFYMGRILHYKLYDTGRREYNEAESDKVIQWLDKAVSISDTIGNAYYYLGVEYGVRGHYAFISGDTLKSKKEFAIGLSKGGYPAWLLEYAENILRSCDMNAVLFTGGDAEVNSLWYLQIVKGMRRDVTILPLGLLSYAPMTEFAKKGINGFFTPMHLTISSDSLEAMSYILCTEDTIELELNDSIMELFDLKNEYKMKWILNPDMEFRGQNITMPGTLILLDFLGINKWERPVYFTLGSQPKLRASLDDFLRIEGMVYRLTPVRTGKNNVEPVITERVVLDSDNYIEYQSSGEHYMPRCSGLLNNYFAVLIALHEYYNSFGETGDAESVKRFIAENLDKGIFKVTESIRKSLNEM